MLAWLFAMQYITCCVSGTVNYRYSLLNELNLFVLFFRVGKIILKKLNLYLHFACIYKIKNYICIYKNDKYNYNENYKARN